MNVWQRLKAWWNDRQTRKRRKQIEKEQEHAPELLEFVYLDDVSLKSLLISQTGTLLTSTSRTISQSDEVAVQSKVSAGNALVGSAEAGSSLKSGSGSSFQSTRKAEVQSLFREFRALPGHAPRLSPDSVEVSKIVRGDLVEVEVDLSVDPLYELIAVTDTFGDMAEAAPQILGGNETTDALQTATPVRKLLDQLMAGLIPIKAKAVNHVVVVRGGGQCVVAKNDLTEDEQTSAQPLFVVGVTEGERYWRDLRRVVFSHSRYTMMARVSRDGLHRNWTPVKGAHLFDGVAPDFMPQLRQAKMPTAAGEGKTRRTRDARKEAFASALTFFQQALADELHIDWTEQTKSSFGELLSTLLPLEASPVAQSQAFEAVKNFVLETGTAPEEPDGETIASMREIARGKAKFEMYPSSSPKAPAAAPETADDEWLLDTEIIAIYW